MSSIADLVTELGKNVCITHVYDKTNFYQVRFTTTKSKKLHNKRVHELYNKRHKYMDRQMLSIHHR